MAFASARMEGFDITQKMETDCMMIVSGELSIQEYIRRVMASTSQESKSDRNVIQS